MDISKIAGSISRGGSTKSEPSRTTEISKIHDTSASSSSFSGLGHFSKGQVFRGQVTNISPTEISIELENGETMHAKYDNAWDLSIGDGAKFKVLSNTNNVITLKALSSPTGVIDSVVLKALDASGLPYSTKNEELVTALLKNEFPVNRQMMNTMLQQSLKNPAISMENLVLMNKAGLPITPETTAMFEAYGEGLSSLTSATDRSFQSMLDMIDGLLINNQSEAASQLAYDFLDVLNVGLEPDANALSLIKDNTVSTSILPNHLADINSILLEIMEKEGKNLPLSSNPSETDHKNQLSSTALSDLFSEKERLDLFTAFENSDVDAGSIQKLLSGEMAVSEFSTLLSSLTEEELRNPSLLPKTLLDFTTKLSVAEQQSALSELLPKSATLTEAGEILKAVLSSPDVTAEQKSLLLKSGDFRNSLKLLVKTNWTLSPSDLLKEDSVNQVYNRMYEQMEKLSLLASKVGESANSLSGDLSHAKQNLDFLNTVAQYYPFTELPLRFHGDTSTGDLYVYSDKSKKRRNPDGSISCLLHLDMNHLGPMNIRIELKENSVSTKFYLEDDVSGKLLSSHLSELDSALNKQGLLPNSEVVKTKHGKEEDSLQKGQFNLVHDFLPSEIEKKNFTRYTFDVRA